MPSRAPCGSAEVVDLEALCLGGHGPDYETLWVLALRVDLAGRALLTLVLAELEPEVAFQEVGAVEGTRRGPRVGPGVVLAADGA